MEQVYYDREAAMSDLLSVLKKLASKYREALSMNKRYPDLKLDSELFDKEINSIKVEKDKIKNMY